MASAFLPEDAVEQVLLDQLRALGYVACHADDVGPDADKPECESHAETLLLPRLRATVDRLNPDLSAQAREDVVCQVTRAGFPVKRKPAMTGPMIQMLTIYLFSVALRMENTFN